MIETILTSIVRKVVFMVILFGGYEIIDNFYFTAFDTDEIIKENPIAISLLLGLIFIALALA